MEARPEWFCPPEVEGRYTTGLRLFNSLTMNKDEFFTQTGDRVVNWYMCGPTVYDASHMGHARTYVCSDIVKRVMRDYFHYDINLTMNITDIDDKIIMRSNEQGVAFSEFARNWELDYMADMEKLNVELPEMLTRVSEFVPEIVEYIGKIIENGFAYEANGSVYFDTEAYKAGGFVYGKLEPSSVLDTEKLAEGEGALTADTVVSEKKGQGDFALWKKSKEGEPKWPSPWGEGRPGWHIECSVMASHTLPCPLDIHSGGVDLRFPHHDNEIAQSEAFYKCRQWVNYFLHTGHLHIQGLKMSKSLKNFITIKEILKKYTSRQIRMLFLLHRWWAMMDYNPATSFTEPIAVEKQFKELFLNLQVAMRKTTMNEGQKWNERDRELAELLKTTKDEVHAALLDNIDTERAVRSLSTLVTQTNVYIEGEALKLTLLVRIKAYLQYILKCFGLNYEDSASETITDPLLSIITNFRADVKKIAKTGDMNAILAACDALRDQQLPELGVRVEDLADGSSVYKQLDPEELKQEIAIKQAEEEEKSKAAAAIRSQKSAKEDANRALAQIPPEEYFRRQADKYSEFDEQGIPTRLADGTEIKKSQKKKLLKELAKHEKLRKKYADS